MIIITGATGKLGSQVLNDLLRRVPADQLVASVRDPQKATALLSRNTTVKLLSEVLLNVVHEQLGSVAIIEQVKVPELTMRVIRNVQLLLKRYRYYRCCSGCVSCSPRKGSFYALGKVLASGMETPLQLIRP